MLLSWYRRRRTARRVRTAFERYLSPKLAAELARRPESLNTSLTTRWLSCLLIQVRDETPEDIRQNAAQVVSICLEHHGVIFDMMASVQLVGFGFFGREQAADSEENIESDRRAATERLLASLVKDVRIVCFAGDICCGNIGGAQRFAFTLAVPGFHKLLAALLNSEFGKSTDVGSIG